MVVFSLSLPRFPAVSSRLLSRIQPSKAGIWYWLQEEAPQMLPSLLALVRQALPPAPEAADFFLGQVPGELR